MRFTIIATVRNEAATIREFVDSLLNQTHSADEILIVDGASTDGTKEILEDYRNRGLLNLISQSCNIAEGRNLGIAAATGTHLAVTDAGCRVDPDWLENIVKYFHSSPTPDVVAGNFRFETHSPFEEAVILATFQPNRDETEAARYYPSSRSIAFSKEAWKKAGGYPEWLYAAEDTLFNIRLRQVGQHFVFGRDAIVRWRPRENWRALAKQRINFSRGNARVGIGTSGYLTNLQVHGLILIFLLAGLLNPLFLGGALLTAAWHIKKHLWHQACRVTSGMGWQTRIRVLLVMEFVRLVNLYGFLQGRWDRFSTPSYVANQKSYMGVGSVDDLDLPGVMPSNRLKRLKLSADNGILISRLLAVAVTLFALLAWFSSGAAKWDILAPIGIVAAVGSAVLLVKSIIDFSQTGPSIRKDIVDRFRAYLFFALARLTAWAFAIMVFTSSLGVFVYYLLITTTHTEWSPQFAILAAAIGLVGSFVLQFIVKLRFNPGLLVASMHYRISRLYALWEWMTPTRINLLSGLLLTISTLLFTTASWTLAVEERFNELLTLWSTALFFASTIAWSVWQPEAKPIQKPNKKHQESQPNILMIGSDTLRADRLGSMGYHRSLTPHIDKLANSGVQFTNCYVPCARTATSLISLLTGTWPHSHGVYDNFVPDEDTHLDVNSLPHILKSNGYLTAALSDWCGADMGKFSFGFDHTDLPKDQWNLKYLIRQGPKDLRLYLSVFTNNQFGRVFLPEVYYLGGVPLTQQIGKRARRLVSRLASEGSPFFLNVFYSTTHPPFASEWPWYVKKADPTYRGESKFAMARLTDPFEILRRQGAPKEEFDLDHIIDLYDSCVTEFDDEISKMLTHLEVCGLTENTIIVVYSDHGMEFFEHNTWGQGNSALGEASARIPLVIKDPRLHKSDKVDQVVRSIDVAPTLLELVGVDHEHSMDGVSLVNYLEHETEIQKLKAYNETGIWITDIPGQQKNHLKYPNLLELIDILDPYSGTLSIKSEYKDIILSAKDRMIRFDKWKLVYQPLDKGHTLLLFDLDSDPSCSNDVSSQHPEIVDSLWKDLSDYISNGVTPTNESQNPGQIV